MRTHVTCPSFRDGDRSRNVSFAECVSKNRNKFAEDRRTSVYILVPGIMTIYIKRTVR